MNIKENQTGKKQMKTYEISMKCVLFPAAIYSSINFDCCTYDCCHYRRSATISEEFSVKTINASSELLRLELCYFWLGTIPFAINEKQKLPSISDANTMAIMNLNTKKLSSNHRTSYGNVLWTNNYI